MGRRRTVIDRSISAPNGVTYNIAHVDLFRLLKTGDDFVETGTYMGNGVQAALAAGFARVHSVEIQPQLYEQAIRSFASELGQRVFLYQGDSVQMLPAMLALVPGRCTFWLDAHLSGIGRPCPTCDEIEVIARFPLLAGSTFIVDDLRDFGTPVHEGITVQQVMEAIRAIDARYRFFTEETTPGHFALVGALAA